MKNCVNDLLNFLTVKNEEVLTGSFYPILLNTPNEGATKFQYEIVDESDKRYATLLDTLQTTSTVQTIKTNDECGFKEKMHVATQDGAFWQIAGVIKRLVTPKNKQALRFFKQTPETVYIIRLIEVDNPWELT